MANKILLYLFLVIMLASHAQAMEAENNYLDQILNGNIIYYEPGLAYANNQAFTHDRLYCWTDAANLYVALLEKNYDPASNVALEFARKLSNWKGTAKIDISMLDDSFIENNSDNLDGALKNLTKLFAFCSAADIFEAWINNIPGDSQVYEEALILANEIIELSDGISSKHAVVKIYYSLIKKGYKPSFAKGAEIAKILNKNNDRNLALKIYLALLFQNYNPITICEEALELAIQGEKKLSFLATPVVSFSIYLALACVKYSEQEFYVSAQRALKKFLRPNCTKMSKDGFDGIKVGYNIYTLLVQQKVTEIYADAVELTMKLLYYSKNDEKFIKILVNDAMGLYEALFEQEQITEEQLLEAKKLVGENSF